METLLGSPHYELIRRIGYREDLIGRYATKAEANLRKQCESAWNGNAGLLVRFREF